MTKNLLVAVWKRHPYCDTKEHDYDDHCGICLPYWKDWPACPTCGRKLGFRNPPDELPARRQCPECKRMILIPPQPRPE